MKRVRVIIGVGAFALLLMGCVPLGGGPSISGVARLPNTLVANPGEWLIAGTFSYQWQRCEADATGCANIAGATSQDYELVAADEAKRVRVAVHDATLFGSGDAYSQPTAVIGPPLLIGTTTRVSEAPDGTQADRESDVSTVSNDGRYVAFSSFASNLVPGDTNGHYDVFVRDTQTGTLTRVSVASDGTQANFMSTVASISGDGRYVAFDSWATDLVPDDTNGDPDVFVHDRETHQTRRISVASDGTQGDNQSFLNNTRLTQGTVPMPTRVISDDGRYITFRSAASNLVPGDTNGDTDAFVHDMQTHTTTRVSVATDGTQADGHISYTKYASLSGDGRYVAFTSDAPNLVAGDTNLQSDVFVHDTQTHTTTLVSVATDGTQGNNTEGVMESPTPSLSTDGRYIAFSSFATNLVAGDTNARKDVFLRDTQTGTTTRISVAYDGTQTNGQSDTQMISGNGRYITFRSRATNLVAGETNQYEGLFLKDTQTGTVTRISVATNGEAANRISGPAASITADGRYITFTSRATNLVASGDNGYWDDVYLLDRG